MSSHFVCAGFEDLMGDISLDEKLGLVNININDSKDNKYFISLSYMQTQVLTKMLKNVLMQADVKRANESNLFGDLRLGIVRKETLSLDD